MGKDTTIFSRPTSFYLKNRNNEKSPTGNRNKWCFWRRNAVGHCFTLHSSNKMHLKIPRTTSLRSSCTTAPDWAKMSSSCNRMVCKTISVMDRPDRPITCFFHGLPVNLPVIINVNSTTARQIHNRTGEDVLINGRRNGTEKGLPGSEHIDRV